MKILKITAFATLFIALLSTPAKAQEIYGHGHTGRYQSHSTGTIWHHGYDDTICEIVFGYVNKSWICTYDDHGTQREDFFGDAGDKFIHGFQFGALFTPSFENGLGLRTGLFFESYISRSSWITYFCHHFAEIDMYIPVHVSYNIPLGADCAFNVFGGIGFQWAMDGKYYRQTGTVWRWWRRPIPVMEGYRHQYGNGWPEKVNWQAECGLNFSIRNFKLGFTYSFGIKDHHIQNTFDDGVTYVTAKSSRQDKMQASIAFAF